MDHPEIGLKTGDYIAIDLDENNRYARAQYEKRNGQPAPSFGWGVCRHGYGLQSFGDEPMTERVARIRAGLLNAGLPVTGIIYHGRT